MVALRKESVDRNLATLGKLRRKCVALRKESVDRNVVMLLLLTSLTSVALRKESVDRNLRSLFAMFRLIRSLSARRAWIEIRRTL